MKKSLLFGVLIIFLIGIVSAEVTLSPNPIEISGKVDEAKTYPLSITNSFGFDVFDFEFGNLEDLGFSFENITIPSNSSGIINVTITPTSSFSGQRSENVEFRFFANISTEITTYDINITKYGFSPDAIIVRKGDTIVWHNNDDGYHSISSLFNSGAIMPNDTYSYTFKSLGTFDYIDIGWDEFTFFHGSVQVISRDSQEKVHNPTYDFTWVLNINHFLNPTTLIVEFEDENFTISANGETESQIKIKNNGSEIAEKVNLSATSNWVIFDENNFNLNPGQQKFVIYKVSPIIFDTEETDKTYDIIMKIKGSNTEKTEKTISVFIPFSEVFTDVNSAEYVFALLEKFCKANPNNLFCNPNRTSIDGENASGNQTVSLNISAVDFFELKRDISKWGTSIIRNGNDLQILADQYGITIPELLLIANSTLSRIEQNQKEVNQSRILRWIGSFFVIIMGMIGATFWKLRKVKRFENIKEGHFKYRT